MTQQAPIAISSFTVTSALGTGRVPNYRRAIEGDSGLGRCNFSDAASLDTWIGEISNVDEVRIPSDLSPFDCRNHRLALLALEQDQFLDDARSTIQRYGADRVGVIMGTSTSGIRQTEMAYASLDSSGELPDWYHYLPTQNIGAVGHFVASILGARGYCVTISTACSSSAKVFASAARALQQEVCDAVIVGGVDSLCLTTLFGFASLQLTSSIPCNPCDIDRDGISIGEAAGYAILERTHTQPAAWLLGHGESADAHHMSSPHPEGKGARLAMQAALATARLEPEEVAYVNLHGTGTIANDSTECTAVCDLLGTAIPCSSTKSLTGHTLGACGIVEAALTIQALQNAMAPGNHNLRTRDPQISANIIGKSHPIAATHALSNSFGFGGSNCSLLFGLDP